MSNIDPLLARNRKYAESGVWRNTPRLPFLPHRGLYVLTCIDPRVDPFEFLGLDFADAIVDRTIGGRVTPAVLQDISYIGYLVESKAPEGPYFELAIIHHTGCGSALLADDDLRHEFEKRAGYTESDLAWLPVLDPPKTVKIDVDRVCNAPQISSKITVSGHVYDVETGLVTTVVPPMHPRGA